MTMNRELRRAQAKQEKKAERDKEERKAARRRRLDSLRSRRTARRAESKESAAKKPDAKGGDGAKSTGKGGGGPAGRGRNPGRFAGALAMATVFFIVLQASVPPQPTDNAVLRSVTGAGFYLLFGYFAILWLMRRDTPRPIVVTLVAGVLLTAGVEVAKLFQPDVPTDLLMLALAVPGLVGGAYLGRLVYTSAPS